jgi:hypothetical protein
MHGNPSRQVCDECQTQFPKGKRFVAPFIIDEGVIEYLCSVCALVRTRKIHNNPEYYFSSKANRKRHKLTIEFLRKAGVAIPAELEVQTF